MTQETTQQQSIELSSVLYLAFELSSKNWKLGFSIGLGQKPRIRTIAAGDLKALKAEIGAAKKRFRLPEPCEVVSCYEAGRDGFWLHRFLTTQGVENFVVDSASIEVNRRRRRAKADKLDVGTLLRMLMRYRLGERKLWSIVHAPSIEEEDRRQLHRELSALEKEKNRTANRIRGLLTTQGIHLASRREISFERLESIRLWDGRPLPDGLKNRIKRECEHLAFLQEQISTLRRERKSALRSTEELKAAPDINKMQMLQVLRGIGPVGAWILVRELFGWRHFKNGRQVGSLSGLCPSPYQAAAPTTSKESAKQAFSRFGRLPLSSAGLGFGISQTQNWPAGLTRGSPTGERRLGKSGSSPWPGNCSSRSGDISRQECCLKAPNSKRPSRKS